MKQQINGEHPYPEDVFNLINQHVDQAIDTALHSLTQILPSPRISLTTPTSSVTSFPHSSTSTPNRSLQPSIAIRCRSSSSRNDRRERKIPFHHTIPRCSLPATQKDRVQYHSRSLSYQQTNHARCRSSQNVNGNATSHRTFDVQYSFSLNKPWLTKIDQQRQNVSTIQPLVNELIEQSIEAALQQVGDQQDSNNDSSSLYFDCSPTCASDERFEIVNSYADQLAQSLVQHSIDDVSSSKEHVIDCLSARLSDTLIVDALSIIANDEGDRTKRQRIHNEVPPHFFQPTPSSPSVDSLVNNLAEQIYGDSFDELRK